MKAFKILKRIAYLIIALLSLGIVFQFSASKMDLFRCPIRGRFAQIGDSKIHYNTYGEGNVTVVFDPGLGLNSLEWSLVQPEVANFAKTFSFDRPGYGLSQKSKQKRTSKNVVRELHDLLMEAQVPPPYLLVGHSLGGINMQLFCHTYPNEVVGLVLVDSSHPDQTARLPKVPPSMEQLNKIIASPMYTILTYLGVSRLSMHFPQTKKILRDALAKFPDRVQKSYHATNQRTETAYAFQSENIHFEESLSQVRNKNLYLQDKFLTVITAGQCSNLYPIQNEDEQEWSKAMVGEWNCLQKELSMHSRRGKHIFAEKSDHLITRNQPEIIIHSIREIVTQL